MSKDRTIEELVRVFHDGDKMTDYELSIFHGHCSEIASKLREMGPEYRILANHAGENARITHEYMVARGIKSDIPFIAKVVSLHELIGAGLFHADTEKKTAYFVAPGYVIRETDGARIQGFEQNGTDFAVYYYTAVTNVPIDKKMFIVYRIIE
jgi:hypothetical protein